MGLVAVQDPGLGRSNTLNNYKKRSNGAGERVAGITICRERKILFADPLHSCTSSLSSIQRTIAVRSAG